MKCKLCERELSDLRRKRCNSCNTKIRRVRAKQAAIMYLGGKCVRCDYNKHPSALTFHHTDKDEKVFTIGNAANKSWDMLKKELDKCILLCANCHHIEHTSRIDERIAEEVAEYKGRLLPL